MTKDELLEEFLEYYYDGGSYKNAFDDVIAPHLPDVIISKDEKEFEDWYKTCATGRGQYFDQMKEAWMAARASFKFIVPETSL